MQYLTPNDHEEGGQKDFHKDKLIISSKKKNLEVNLNGLLF